ncbi:MAG: hypothetical protein J0H43_13755 [Actinobacteria bacterium]|nr:hypothetical protein [Actinomycetota bacterium]
MTATHTSTTTTLPWLVGDRVQIQHKGQPKPGRISSIHHINDGVEYVVRTDRADPAGGGVGEVLNIWTSSGTSSFLTALDGPS